ncbi:hypothetical protein CDC59_07540 [Ralstonia solanacearum]|nr:hypothetical protein CDC59_07540 [Ralstonia solanacearum]
MHRERERQRTPAFNAERVYHARHMHDRLLERRSMPPHQQRRHNGEPLRMTVALDCCDREAMSGG